MANKYNKGVSGSVQEKRGMLYLVVSYKDPITQKSKVKWIGLGIPSGSPKSVINKAKRDAQSKFEKEYKRFLDGYDALTADKAAEIIGYAPHTVLSYIRQKRIFAVQISGKYILPKSALVDFLVDDFAFEIVHKSLWHMNTILGFTEQK